jgi:hypothetical protein
MEVALMRRVPWALVLMLMFMSRPSSAIQLRWSTGSSDLAFTEAVRCTLLVEADSAEVRLPSEWRPLVAVLLARHAARAGRRRNPLQPGVVRGG